MPTTDTGSEPARTREFWHKKTSGELPRRFFGCMKTDGPARHPENHLPQHCLYFLPLPHVQGSFRPTLLLFAGFCATGSSPMLRTRRRFFCCSISIRSTMDRTRSRSRAAWRPHATDARCSLLAPGRIETPRPAESFSARSRKPLRVIPEVSFCLQPPAVSPKGSPSRLKETSTSSPGARCATGSNCSSSGRTAGKCSSKIPRAKSGTSYVAPVTSSIESSSRQQNSSSQHWHHGPVRGWDPDVLIMCALRSGDHDDCVATECRSAFHQDLLYRQPRQVYDSRGDQPVPHSRRFGLTPHLTLQHALAVIGGTQTPIGRSRLTI